MRPPSARGGKVVGRYDKRFLPNYGVFDEQRWLTPGSGQPSPLRVAGVPVGVTICEDMWFAGGPMVEQAKAGALLLVNLNASPYSRGVAGRNGWTSDRAGEGTRCPIVYVNQVGGQDELVFDGASLVVGPGGIMAAAAQFEEEILIVEIDTAGHTARPEQTITTLPVPSLPCSVQRPRCMPPWSSAPGTTWPKTASPTPSSGCPAGSIRHW